MAHSPCFYFPLPIPLSPSLYPFYLLGTLLAVTGIVHLGLRLFVNWPPLDPPLTQPSPFQIPRTPTGPAPYKDDLGNIPDSSIRNTEIIFNHIFMLPMKIFPFILPFSEYSISCHKLSFDLFLSGFVHTVITKKYYAHRPAITQTSDAWMKQKYRFCQCKININSKMILKDIYCLYFYHAHIQTI